MYSKEDGKLPATFKILYLIGWKPGKDMPQPARRGEIYKFYSLAWAFSCSCLVRNFVAMVTVF